ncbi:MAG: hydroxyacylglutathione hydrolase C-terminal domain-containing protein [Elusimicrobiota bacterium]
MRASGVDDDVAPLAEGQPGDPGERAAFTEGLGDLTEGLFAFPPDGRVHARVLGHEAAQAGVVERHARTAEDHARGGAGGLDRRNDALRGGLVPEEGAEGRHVGAGLEDVRRRVLGGDPVRVRSPLAAEVPSGAVGTLKMRAKPAQPQRQSEPGQERIVSHDIGTVDVDEGYFHTVSVRPASSGVMGAMPAGPYSRRYREKTPPQRSRYAHGAQASMWARSRVGPIATSSNQPTVPSTMEEEIATNPFMRADNPAVQEAVGMKGGDPGAVFTKLRELKNTFKG